MSDYTFDALNDKEFEVFCCDLLGQEKGVRFERFKSGKDGGVDGRYFTPSGGEIVLQCKHWVRTPIEQLIRHLNRSEKRKLDRLSPVQYIIAVSNPLSRTEKQAIREALAPHLPTAADIFGREDLNDLLGRHPLVERRHYKLWLSSSQVLNHLINKAIVDRSTFSLEEMISKSKMYAPTASHDLALAKLEEHGVLLVTGEAGIGKTTLAEQLCLSYAYRGYELIQIGDEISEAEAVFKTDTKQIFYFDDFLGRNYLAALSGHEGSRIVQLIRRIARDKLKKFILTSRTTILNQGRVLIDNLQHQNVDRSEFQLTIESFSEIDRAKILYNHIWHSDLDTPFVDALYEQKRYRNIIQHRNFNPRLISYITDSEKLFQCTAASYWNHVNSMLENPAAVWDNAFNSQLDDFGRTIVLLVVLNGKNISQEELSSGLFRFSARPENSGMQGRKDFVLNLRHLLGSMLSRVLISKESSEARITLFNPSIGDYVLRRYTEDLATLSAGFQSLRSRSSLGTLDDLRKNKLLSSSFTFSTFSQILEIAISEKFVGYTSEYIAAAFIYIAKNSLLPMSVARACARFVCLENCPFFIADAAEVVIYGRKENFVTTEEAVRFLNNACGNHPHAAELKILLKLLVPLEGENAIDEKTKTDYESAVENYLCDSIHEEIEVEDIFGSVDYEDDRAARRNLKDAVERKLESFGLEDSDICDRLVEAYDFYDKKNDFFRHESSYRRDEIPRVTPFQVDEIDDLFSRDVDK